MKMMLRSTAVAVGMGVAASAGASADTTLTIVSWGGAYTESQQKAYHEPYMEKNPEVTILNDDSAAEGLAKLRAQVESGNVTWDIVDMIASDSITACDEGLIYRIDPDEWLAPAPDGTPASEDFFEGTLSPGGTDCFIPQIVYSTTFGYRTDMVDTAPQTIGDVFDLEKIPGKRSLQQRPLNNLEWALISDGVPGDKVYEALDEDGGVDRAFSILDTVKTDTVWWSKGARPPQLLADGEVVMASAYNGRLFNAIAVEKQPIAMMWDWQSFDLDGWTIPLKDAKIDVIKDYIYFATDTQRLADQAKFISYGPARKSSAPLVGNHAELGIDMKPHMPTDPKNAENVLQFDYVWWADNGAEMDERFNAWLAQ
ncbi:MAG: extracellular solute-binding protein [Marivibrio sp.]|uniref:extracellular solute-binding protein n=1 Tax=Marivibrio sp. TaxID=2039719 RepID=UPI0032EBCBC2